MGLVEWKINAVLAEKGCLSIAMHGNWIKFDVRAYLPDS